MGGENRGGTIATGGKRDRPSPEGTFSSRGKTSPKKQGAKGSMGNTGNFIKDNLGHRESCGNRFQSYSNNTAENLSGKKGGVYSLKEGGKVGRRRKGHPFS